MRLPIPIVTTHLKAILDGILLWSADTKNQFKLKVSILHSGVSLLWTEESHFFNRCVSNLAWPPVLLTSVCEHVG